MTNSIDRCPDCGKVIALRFPMHDCTHHLETRSLVGDVWTPWVETTRESASLTFGMFYRPMEVGETISVPYAQLRRSR